MRLEEEFDVEISDERAATLSTVKQISDCVHELRESRGFNGSLASRDETLQRVRIVIAAELSVPLERVSPHADIVRDLGAD